MGKPRCQSAKISICGSHEFLRRRQYINQINPVATLHPQLCVCERSNVWILGPPIWNHSCFGISQCAGNAASRLVVKPHCTTYAYATSGLGNQPLGILGPYWTTHMCHEMHIAFSFSRQSRLLGAAAPQRLASTFSFPSRLYSYNDPAVWYAFFSVARVFTAPIPLVASQLVPSDTVIILRGRALSDRRILPT